MQNGVLTGSKAVCHIAPSLLQEIEYTDEICTCEVDVELDFWLNKSHCKVVGGLHG